MNFMQNKKKNEEEEEEEGKREKNFKEFLIHYLSLLELLSPITCNKKSRKKIGKEIVHKHF